MIFKSDIIDNPKFKKYELLRDILLMILVVCGIPAYFMGGGRSNRNSIREELERTPDMIYYFYGLIIIGIIYWIINFYTRKAKNIGKLRIEKDSIEIELYRNGYKKIHKTSDFEKVVIIRNSTYHKDEDQIVKPYKGNNWIELHLDKEKVDKYEFTIESLEHSQDFEKIISILRSELRRKLDYRSI